MPPVKRDTHVARYENTNGIGIAIVAVVTHDKMDGIFDWAAYIGGLASGERTADAVTAARKWGNKLRISDAHHYFPHLPMERYRE